MTASNTVDTIEDVIRILRERPEIREAVRREILTDELLELPGKVAEMAAILREVVVTLREHGEAINELKADVADLKTDVGELKTDVAELKTDVADLKTDVADLKTDVADLKTDVAELKTDVGELKTDVAELKTDVGELKTDVGELKTDVGELKTDVGELKTDVAGLKGLAAFGPAERRYEVIALEMGLEPHRLLTPGDIARLTMREAASEFSDSELESFKNCDLVIGAESPGVGECYIAVQVSYTVDHADIDRAIKHSEMVTRFTGRPGYAAVSGVERAGVTERRLASDAIHWHRLPSRELQPR